MPTSLLFGKLNVNKNTKLNLPLLQNALFQIGPWKNEDLNIDNQWVATKLKEKADRLD